MKSFYTKKIDGKRGFTLFFAVLVSGVALAIGTALLNVALKELILSSTIRDSQYAFYAADAAVECALYWDLKYDAFSPATSSQAISCNNQNFTAGGTSQTTLSGLQFSPEPYCANVIITKTGSGGIYSTDIQARGYNTCVTSNPRRVERGIIVKY